MIELIWNRTVKAWALGAITGLLIGAWLGMSMKIGEVYQDCRVMGSVRLGDAAFKCEQFSKAVLLQDKK